MCVLWMNTFVDELGVIALHIRLEISLSRLNGRQAKITDFFKIWLQTIIRHTYIETTLQH